MLNKTPTSTVRTSYPRCRHREGEKLPLPGLNHTAPAEGRPPTNPLSSRFRPHFPSVTARQRAFPRDSRPRRAKLPPYTGGKRTKSSRRRPLRETVGGEGGAAEQEVGAPHPLPPHPLRALGAPPRELRGGPGRLRTAVLPAAFGALYPSPVRSQACACAVCIPGLRQPC